MAFAKAKNHHWNTLDEIKENAGDGEHKGELWMSGEGDDTGISVWEPKGTHCP